MSFEEKNTNRMERDGGVLCKIIEQNNIRIHKSFGLDSSLSFEEINKYTYCFSYSMLMLNNKNLKVNNSDQKYKLLKIEVKRMILSVERFFRQCTI